MKRCMKAMIETRDARRRKRKRKRKRKRRREREGVQRLRVPRVVAEDARTRRDPSPYPTVSGDEVVLPGKAMSY